jgi:uncharacterized repeat protein (TIGR03803 family)
VKTPASLRERIQAKANRIVLNAAVVVTAFLSAAAPRLTEAQTVTTLYDFASSSSTAVNPAGVIAQGTDGNYYGTAYGPGQGSIYKVTASGTFTTLHQLVTGEGQLCNGLILGTDTNLYGSCENGGTVSGFGTIYKITTAGAITQLHVFNGGTTDGCYPEGVPVQASDGNFYGTTTWCGTNNLGIAYKITPTGTLTIIHTFGASSTDAGHPEGALIQGSDGNLWGTSNAGGSGGSGTVFKMTTAGKVTVMHQFVGCGSNGCDPAAGLVQGKDGNYYGTTQSGGANNEGTVFKITPAGVLTVLHSFNTAKDNGAYPIEPLTLGTDGNFYGIGTDCISGGCGQADIFKITPKGVFTDVYNFPLLGGNNNSAPESPLLLGTDGVFYSTTDEGGSRGSGTFFSLVDGQTSFALLLQNSGKVGAVVGILGQGFSSSSTVKFNGKAATSVTVTGSTYITATVPTGATTGFVTVTTGTTTLTSSSKFTVK